MVLSCYMNTDRNKRLRPIRHKISNDDLHTSVDKNMYCKCKTGSFTCDSVIGYEGAYKRFLNMKNINFASKRTVHKIV